MANLPGSGYLSHADRTEGEMQTALEQLHDVIAELGSKAPTLLTISGDAITTPLASMILVQSEGHGSDVADVLDSIGTTNITQGRLVILKNNDGTSTESAGQTITVTHGTSAGDITLTEGSGTFLLCAERMLAVIYSGDRWVEVWRSYGRANSEDKLAERTSLGLGDVSTLNVAAVSGPSAASKVLKVGPAENIATNDLLAMDANGNIKTGAVTGGNADTLDSHDSLSFVRTDAGSPQSINANVTATTASATRIVTDTTGVSQTAGFAMHDDGVERALVYLDTQDGDVYLKTSDSEAAPQAAIKIDAATGKLEYSSEMGTSSFVSLTPGAGNGLNADLLDGIEGIDLITRRNGAASLSSAAGSFKITDGTTNLLVQWGGTWSNTGSANSSGRVRLTFPVAFTSAPHIIGGGYIKTIDYPYAEFGRVSVDVVNVYEKPQTITSTYIQIPRTYYVSASYDSYNVIYTRTGQYLAIGVVA